MMQPRDMTPEADPPSGGVRTGTVLGALHLNQVRCPGQERSDCFHLLVLDCLAFVAAGAVANAILSLLAFMDGLGARVLRFKLWVSELELEQPRPRVPIKGMHEGVLYGLCRD